MSAFPPTGEIIAYTDEDLFAACGVRIAFTEREGGVSAAPFASLNMMAGNDDDEICAAYNRAAICAAFGAEGLLMPHQVHGSQSVVLDAADKESLSAAQCQADAGCDAVVLDCTGPGALLRFADCLPLILVASTGAFAIVHCGWRGVVAHLAARTALQLIERTQADPSGMNAYIGPYIHAECFEVGKDTADIFEREFDTSVFASLSQEPEGRALVDLGAAVRQDLAQAGIAAERIADVDICTACSTDRFFSYRAEGGITGRHAAFALRTRTTEQL